MNNTKRAFILYMAIFTAQFSVYAPSVLPLMLTLTQKLIGYLPTSKESFIKVKQYIPIRIINDHKKPIITGIATTIAAGVSYIRWNNNHKKTRRRRIIELKLELQNTTFIKTVLNTIFNTKLWKILWGIKNINLKNVFHGNNQKIQRKLLKEMVPALTSNNSTTLEVLTEKPFCKDQFFHPNIVLPLSENGKTIAEQIKNGYQDINIDPLNPQSYITPLQYVIVSDLTTDNKLKLINILLANGADPLGQDQNSNDALHYAVKYTIAKGNHDIKIIKRLVEAGAQADIPGRHSITCMHLVSDIKDDQTRAEIAKILIQCNPDMNVIDESGNTPLLNAVKQGRVELVKLFLNKTDAKIDQIDREGNSILMLAMLQNGEKKNPNCNDNSYINIINYLLSCSNISKITDLANKSELRPIHYAMYYQNYTLIDSLTKNHQVNITQETEITDQQITKKQSPIQFAFSCNDEKALETFLENNTIPTSFKTSDGDTLAHLIVGLSVGSLYLMNLAIEKNFLLNEKNATNKTPLEIAFEEQHLDLVEFLLKQKKIESDTVFSDGETPAHKIVSLDNHKGEHLIEVLSNPHFNCNIKNRHDMTPFQLALTLGKNKLVIWFIKKLNPLRNIAFEYKNTPAHIAAQFKNAAKAVELMTILETNRFPLDQQNSKGETILHIAVKHRNEKLAEWINDRYFNLRYIPNNKHHQTPLHYVGKRGDRRLYKWFKLDEKDQKIDSQGKTPWQLLQENQSHYHNALDCIASLESAAETRAANCEIM